MISELKTSKIKHPLIKSSSILLYVLLNTFSIAETSSYAQTQSLMDKALSYLDIYHFKKPILKSPEFAESRIIKQPFDLSCAKLNRIILAFYLNDGERVGKIDFNLYRSDNPSKSIFKKRIDLSILSEPKPIGTHREKGTLIHIWIPKHIASEKKSYFWTLNPLGNVSRNNGIFFSHKKNHQLQPVLVDDHFNPSEFAAFYAYCSSNFEWDFIMTPVKNRLIKDKFFISFHLILIGSLIFYLRKLGDSK